MSNKYGDFFNFFVDCPLTIGGRVATFFDLYLIEFSKSGQAIGIRILVLVYSGGHTVLVWFIGTLTVSGIRYAVLVGCNSIPYQVCCSGGLVCLPYQVCWFLVGCIGIAYCIGIPYLYAVLVLILIFQIHNNFLAFILSLLFYRFYFILPSILILCKTSALYESSTALFFYRSI